MYIYQYINGYYMLCIYRGKSESHLKIFGYKDKDITKESIKSNLVN